METEQAKFSKNKEMMFKTKLVDFHGTPFLFELWVSIAILCSDTSSVKIVLKILFSRNLNLKEIILLKLILIKLNRHLNKD